VCETCVEAKGLTDDYVTLPCDCPCSIRLNSTFLKFRPLVCAECGHIALP
jgi:hypothetical protein